MVRLEWNLKLNTSNKLDEYIERFKNKFDKVNLDLGNLQNKSIDQEIQQNWRNKLFWGDNREVLYHLLNSFKHKIDLIYIDPPFFSGSNYHIQVKEKGKEYEVVAYHDHWDKDLNSYLQMLYERLSIMKKLLSEKGLIFVHLDWHASHYIRVILDEIFGQKRFINNIVWHYYNKYSAGKNNLPRAHDDILVYSKSNDYTFNEVRELRKKPKKQLKREMVNGVLKNAKDENGHVIYRIVTDKKIDDVWRIPCMQPASKEWTGFPTQKHHDLLERIIQIGSNEGDIIADFFCGSGTTLLAAENLKRRWIGCDISEFSIYLTYNRIKAYQKSEYEFDIYTELTEERKKIIQSGFFEKELKIKRKK